MYNPNAPWLAARVLTFSERQRQNAEVVVRVEHAEIAERVRIRRQQQLDGVDVWVRLDEADPQRRLSSVDVVREAASRVPGGSSWTIRPTTGGIFVWISPPVGVDAKIELLVAELPAGCNVQVTVPPWRPGGPERVLRPAPTAFFALACDPPPSRGPFNVHGVPEPRWGVPPRVSDAFLARSAYWVLEAGDRMQLGNGNYFVPAHVDDFADLFKDFWADRVFSLRLISTDSTGSVIRRSARFDPWGVAAWCDADSGQTQVARALSLQDQLTVFAEDLDYGAVSLTLPGSSEADIPSSSIWTARPDLHDAYVPKPHAIQVLTSRQLERTHDLTGWDVEGLGADRWAVSARDLDPWFALEEPEPLWTDTHPAAALREQGFYDFGHAVLSRQTAKAIPRPGHDEPPTQGAQPPAPGW